MSHRQLPFFFFFHHGENIFLQQILMEFKEFCFGTSNRFSFRMPMESEKSVLVKGHRSEHIGRCILEKEKMH